MPGSTLFVLDLKWVLWSLGFWTCKCVLWGGCRVGGLVLFMSTSGVAAPENNRDSLFGWSKVRRVWYCNVRGEAPLDSMDILWRCIWNIIWYPDPIPLGPVLPPAAVVVRRGQHHVGGIFLGGVMWTWIHSTIGRVGHSYVQYHASGGVHCLLHFVCPHRSFSSGW